MCPCMGELSVLGVVMHEVLRGVLDNQELKGDLRDFATFIHILISVISIVNFI